MIDGAAIAMFTDLCVLSSGKRFLITYTEFIDFNESAHREGTRCGMAPEQSGQASLAGLSGHPWGQSAYLTGYYFRTNLLGSIN